MAILFAGCCKMNEFIHRNARRRFVHATVRTNGRTTFEPHAYFIWFGVCGKNRSESCRPRGRTRARRSPAGHVIISSPASVRHPPGCLTGVSNFDHPQFTPCVVPGIEWVPAPLNGQSLEFALHVSQICFSFAKRMLGKMLFSCRYTQYG